MDCKHARLLLTFAREQDDLDACDARDLRAHLSQCAECDALAAAERRFDRAVSRAMVSVPLPEGLKERLFLKIAPQRPWLLRRWILGPAAAAACLLVAAGLTWYWLPRPVALNITADHRFFTFTGASVDEVEQWFKDRDVPMVYPTAFNVNRLESISIASYQGKPVGKLFFLARGDDGRIHSAHVLCFDQRRFQTDAPGSFPTNHELYRDNGFAYLIIYAGSLDELRGAAK